MALSTSKPILLATGMTAGSNVVLEVGVKLAVHLGASLVVLHVVTEGVLAESRDSLPKERAYVDVIVGERTQDLREQIERISDQNPPGCAYRVRVAAEGEPGAQILETLRREAFEYAVIGVRNRSRIGKLILGSVTQDVLLGSPVPVVAVPI